jgi:hypothetical protein
MVVRAFIVLLVIVHCVSCLESSVTMTDSSIEFHTINRNSTTNNDTVVMNHVRVIDGCIHIDGISVYVWQV